MRAVKLCASLPIKIYRGSISSHLIFFLYRRILSYSFPVLYEGIDGLWSNYLMNFLASEQNKLGTSKSFPVNCIFQSFNHSW